VLVFPYYTSNDTGSADTLMSISNTGNASVIVHLYFMEGISCAQADIAVFLTPNATVTLQAFNDMPMETGYLIAVAVDQNGGLVANAGLTGSAFVKAPAGYLAPTAGEIRGNYGAMAFNAYMNMAAVGGELTLNFNGAILDQMPSSFAAAIQSPNAAPNQTIVMAGMNGNLNTSTVTGASQIGTGGAYNANEVFRSFVSLIRGGCQSLTALTNSNPRIVGVSGSGLSGLIPAGTVGTLRFSTEGGVGLLITPRNNAGWSGIRNLTYTRTSSVTLIVPSF
jgi:hypothetical protein